MALYEFGGKRPTIGKPAVQNRRLRPNRKPAEGVCRSILTALPAD